MRDTETAWYRLEVEERIGREPQAIRRMFAGVARRYDLLNRSLSLGQDRRWRRNLIAAVADAPAGPCLDLATGTGDVALLLPCPVVGADFCLEMLALGRAKARRSARLPGWVAADALGLPFRDRSFAAVTVAFGVRNFSSLTSGLAEIVRVLAPGGLLGVLEFQRPPVRWKAALHRMWGRWVVAPLGGWLSDDGSAYAYLPASMADFPDRIGLQAALRSAGLYVVKGCEFSLGVVGLTVARKEE